MLHAATIIHCKVELRPGLGLVVIIIVVVIVVIEVCIFRYGNHYLQLRSDIIYRPTFMNETTRTDIQMRRYTGLYIYSNVDIRTYEKTPQKRTKMAENAGTLNELNRCVKGRAMSRKYELLVCQSDGTPQSMKIILG